MITELLGLAGSGATGAAFGMINRVLQSRAENKRLETQLEIQRRANENGQRLDYVKEISADSGWYSVGFLIMCCTYATCTIACFFWPNIDIYTFNPDETPKVYSFLWGFLQYEHQINYVYSISTGGLGFSLLHPIAFMICSVISGSTPVRRS
jgi:hypothetical protein